MCMRGGRLHASAVSRTRCAHACTCTVLFLHALLRPASLRTGYMLVNCRKSCKVCDPAKTNTGRVIEVPAKTAATRR